MCHLLQMTIARVVQNKFQVHARVVESRLTAILASAAHSEAYFMDSQPEWFRMT